MVANEYDLTAGPASVLLGTDTTTRDPVFLPYAARDRGVALIGKAGTGKSSLLEHMILADLELDLDVFQGPFDLLLALVLREEVELADVPIAEIVVAYIERAYEKGELDLESASEFLVLMAALLEIKVRLLFPDEAGAALSVRS